MKNVLIIGANSAVATELARRYAHQGDRLFLVARDSQKLDLVCKELGEAVKGTYIADFNDTSQAQAIVDEAASQFNTIDVAIIAHGYLGDQLQSEQDFSHAYEVIHTNYINVVALLIPLVEHMKHQAAGKIGVLLSVAGDRGRPRNFTYGAAKGALAIHLQGLRSVLYKSGLEIFSFKLGPVDSPMTVDHEKNFSFSSVDRVASCIIKGLESKRHTQYVPGYWYWVMLVVRLLPEPVFQKLRFLSDR
ncbi:MAG: short-chain dehydrogenase [Gammaproteobacteria bacterium]|nr:MAG: short-chain dehydrogenase [Gammaproteobacteria bacterium]